MSPNHPVATLPSRLLTPDEVEERLRARQPWADLWRRVHDTNTRTPRAEPAAPTHEHPDDAADAA